MRATLLLGPDADRGNFIQGCGAALYATYGNVWVITKCWVAIPLEGSRATVLDYS